MAFGIASGVTPQAGIYTAIVGGFLVSLLGGSRIQIGGPTGAFVVIVAGIIAKHGLSGLLMVTMMAGVILLFLALTGLGQAVKFIPRPVVLGFTNGIALLIASTQIKDFLGLTHGRDPERVLRAHGGDRRQRCPRSTRSPSALATRSLALVLLVPRVAAAPARVDRGAARGHGGGRRCSSCPSRRSDRSSAGSPAACRPSRFRNSAPT